MGCKLQEAIKLFNSKNYKDSMNIFLNYLKENPHDSECLTYIFSCCKNIKSSKTDFYFNKLIESLFDQKEFNKLLEIINKNKNELNLQNKINYIYSLFENGEVNKSNQLYLNYLKAFLENKNYVAVNKMLTIERDIMKFNPKLELIKIIFWNELSHKDKIYEFLKNLEETQKKYWKSFRDQKVDKTLFLKKVISILDSKKEEDSRIQKLISYLELKNGLRKFNLQEQLEYIILNINDPVAQSYILEELDEDIKEDFIELIRSMELKTEEKRKLANGFFEFEKNRIQIVEQYNEDEISEILKFDQLPSKVDEVDVSQNEYKYSVSDDEKELIKKVERGEFDEQYNFVSVLIENSFLVAAKKLALRLSDKEEKNYYLSEILFRLEHWSDLIDLCMKNYQEVNENMKKIFNYFIGVSYLEKGDGYLALKYLNKVIAEDPNYRSVKEKAEIAKNK